MTSPLYDHNPEAAARGEERAIVDRNKGIQNLDDHVDMLENHPDQERRTVEREFAKNMAAQLRAAEATDRKNHPSTSGREPKS